MESKQTAVQFLSEHDTQATIDFAEGKLSELQYMVKKTIILHQALQIEKEQIINAFVSASKDSCIDPLKDKYYEPEAEQYYNENYGK